jgi:hypothetical protein
MLASLAPFAIDTYLPAFHIIADDFFTSPESIQQSLNILSSSLYNHDVISWGYIRYDSGELELSSGVLLYFL